uniref:Protein farnesyltransferase/geranylgeranyltransferase type-1 subunit alpha n=1 Tax=Spongospora subterranea TaxID=70186 RepID=A0A0H5R673_9EUKA|eukprot:CRZ09633.1 hypothetical protein [Spongospora subterranea]
MSLSISELQSMFSDIAPIPQDDGPEPVVSIQYPYEFSFAMNIFRAVLAVNELSERTLTLSEHIIRINAANYTAWHFRRQILTALCKDWKDELRLCDSIAEMTAKNYQLWYHRREAVEKLRDPSTELQHTAEVFRNDPKNYHSWSHRQWVISEFSLWNSEIQFIEQCLVEDPFNNSAWNQRWFIVTKNNTVDISDPLVIAEEIKFAIGHLQKIPQNESPWNYILGVLEHTNFPKSTSSEVADFSKSVLLTCPQCRFAASTLLEIYIASGNEHQIAEAVKLSEMLEKDLDCIRSKYWIWRREEMLRKEG